VAFFLHFAFCIALHLLLHLLCFAFALQTGAFHQGVAHVKIKKTLATPQISCALFPPPEVNGTLLQSVGITVSDVYLEWEPDVVASLLLHQWTTQSSPPDGGRNALMPHSVWLGAYIVRRPVARRSFALKKLD
jgi:hypothetical protein